MEAEFRKEKALACTIGSLHRRVPFWICCGSFAGGNLLDIGGVYSVYQRQPTRRAMQTELHASKFWANDSYRGMAPNHFGEDSNGVMGRMIGGQLTPTAIPHANGSRSSDPSCPFPLASFVAI